MRAHTIGWVARAAGVGVETVRFYERKGLIERPPKPPGSAFRSYPKATVRRLRFIRQAQELGFTLREITELLSLRADANADCAEVRAHARIKLEEVDRRMASLVHLRAALEALIKSCPGRGALRSCTILQAMEASVERDGRSGNLEEERT
jgi:MerR family mercuric resistance operon transcriptional regulator